jgi:uncharacterized protein (DUF1697 family)
MNRYVALLRGINVGGNNLIKMPALKASFEKQGFAEVATYIQSGNVVFSSRTSRGLEKRIEASLSEEFGYAARVTVRDEKQLRTIIEKAPKGFGSKPDKFRYDVLFVFSPRSAAEVMKLVELKEGVDTADAGNGVVYHSRLIAKATSSRLRKIIALPIYKELTIRNWKTTSALHQLAQRKE